MLEAVAPVVDDRSSLRQTAKNTRFTTQHCADIFRRLKWLVKLMQLCQLLTINQIENIVILMNKNN